MALALAASSAVPVSSMRTIVIASALALVSATPSDSSAARETRACPRSGAACEAEPAHSVIVRRARGAVQEGSWNEAADLWTTRC